MAVIIESETKSFNRLGDERFSREKTGTSKTKIRTPEALTRDSNHENEQINIPSP
jgi:hypothetical protein